MILEPYPGLRQAAADADGVLAAEPVQLIFVDPGRGFARLVGAAAAGVRERGGATAVTEIQVEAALVGNRGAAEERGRQLRRETRRAAGPAGVELVDEVRAERRSQRLRRRVARRLLAAGVGKAGEKRLARVGRVRRRVDVVVIERTRQPVVLRDVVVDATQRVRRVVVAVDLEGRGLQKRVGTVDDGSLATRGTDIAQQLRHRRIERGRLAPRRGKREQVDGLGPGGRVVRIETLRALLAPDRAASGNQAWRPVLFVIEEEEGFVVSVPDAWNHDGAASVEAGLLHDHLPLRRLSALGISL